MNNIPEQPYEAPRLEPYGSVSELTAGHGFFGNADQFWFISWGRDKPKDGWKDKGPAS